MEKHGFFRGGPSSSISSANTKLSISGALSSALAWHIVSCSPSLSAIEREKVGGGERSSDADETPSSFPPLSPPRLCDYLCPPGDHVRLGT